MREGYDRIASNNVIVNNSLHPHVWYPESGDVFKANIVFGAYRPAVMSRGIEADGKWGQQLDSNLFASNEDDMHRFLKKGCDSTSITGDPLFLDMKNGDYRVGENSPALLMGFTNFPMDEFGVVSAKLRKLAKKPDLPQILNIGSSPTGMLYKWLGADVKNVETLGEQSANGLSSMSGIMLLDVPEKSRCARMGFKTGDVIIGFEETEVKTFTQLKRLLASHSADEISTMGIMRNQKKEEILVKK
jgi:hypothetical protein